MLRQGLISISISLLLAITPGGFAYEGELDTAFSSDGKVTIDMSSGAEWARAMAIQDDGKIVVVGTGSNTNEDIVVLRLHTDGTRDMSFDGDGRATFNFVWGNDQGWDVAIQDDGKIVIVGSARIDTLTTGAVLRLNQNGSLDTSFNGYGYNTVTLPGDTYFFGVDLQSDGKIVAVGKTATGSSIVIVRLTTTGSFDSTFSNDGVQTWDGAWGNDVAWDVKALAGGKILVGGFVQIDTISNFAVLRYNSNGSIDTGFGYFGYSLFHFGDDSYGRALAVQDNGRIVITGSTDVGSAIALARLTSSGSLDTSFSTDGMATYNGFWGNDEGRDVVLQEDGKIVVGGMVAIDTLDNFALTRWTTSGSLDTSFGPTSAGIMAVNFSFDAFGYAVAIQPSNGTIMLAGHTDVVGSTPAFALTCHQGAASHSGIFADTLETGSTNMWSSMVQ